MIAPAQVAVAESLDIPGQKVILSLECNRSGVRFGHGWCYSIKSFLFNYNLICSLTIRI